MQFFGHGGRRMGRRASAARRRQESSDDYNYGGDAAGAAGGAEDVRVFNEALIEPLRHYGEGDAGRGGCPLHALRCGPCTLHAQPCDDADRTLRGGASRAFQ